MVGVDKDDFIVLVNTVLVNPVGVQHAEVATSAPNTLLSNCAKASLELEVVHTLADGLAVCRTLGNGLLAVATADTNAVDNVALLGLVAEAAGLVGTGGARGAVDDVQLTKLY